MLKKLGKKKIDMLSIDLIITNFYGTIAQPISVLSIELTVGYKMAKIIFFIIKIATTYNALSEVRSILVDIYPHQSISIWSCGI